ncbi:phytoene dehydrogenase-like protein [Halorubrum alkaliphilum]|uniref:Phytoene dehydrogenase-like protein n=1 Tax=Halorubrum alkaliphilum TaxID=261290 RepID=A0A8T4GAW8_9EURY|nr:NAD(P)/FAD-dependent oxidoreductase [Halorubrum alkaliphilum]MBP1921554.1 phytoene dehydrogenase-like protein [Halorubrum alkaliphilum]
MDADVIVVGGGLAGLVSATRLAESGADTVLLERRPTVGGRVRTREVDGFTLDRGFQVLFTSYPAVARELDTDALDLRAFSPGATICRPGSRAVLSDPLREPTAAIESALNHEIPFSDKLRTLALRYDLSKREENEFFAGPDASIREYLTNWGFSAEYIENFVEPFYGGITLDRSLSSSKHVFEYTFRAMGRGSIAVPADGMAAIGDQLAERARDTGVEIRTGEDVESVDVGSGGRFRLGSVGPAEGARVELLDGGTLDASAVIVATTPPEARSLTGVESVPEAGVPNVTAWYTLPEDVEFETGKRILLNAASESPNAVVPMSEVAPEYAPPDRALLGATFLGEDALARDDADLLADTRDALSAWFPERGFEGLETVDVDRVPFAQFAQPPGVHAALPDADDPEGPVVLAGEYTEWSAIQGAMKSGARAATVTRDYL